MSAARWGMSRGVLKARCGHLMTSVVPHPHEQPPGHRNVCTTCAAISRVPPPRFPQKLPAGRRCRSGPPLRAPGGQPDSISAALERVVAVLRLMHPGIEARWARCPVEGHLHLLAPAGVAAEGFAYALCGRAVAADGLAVHEWSSGTHCVSCLAAGIAS
ncbi:MAG: hypothetical protein ACRDRO_27655 [Pseudonocardiaceae bacterium]